MIALMEVGDSSAPPAFIAGVGRRGRALLVRVGADATPAGGQWHGLVNSATGEFVYVPIPEQRSVRPGFATLYADVAPELARFRRNLPSSLAGRQTHLDPDFLELTYGDRSERARQIQRKLASGDSLVFYMSLRDTRGQHLVYALVGALTIDRILHACDVPETDWHRNAHTRREPIGETDIVVFGRRESSGRFERCVPFADRRDGAYRVWPELLNEWGGLSVKNGYVQRSARLPEFCDAARFLVWLDRQDVTLIARNN